MGFLHEFVTGCAICGRFPHRTRCPNEEEKVVFFCAVCGGEVLEGEDAYFLLGQKICQSCVREGRYIVENE